MASILINESNTNGLIIVENNIVINENVSNEAEISEQGTEAIVAKDPELSVATTTEQPKTEEHLATDQQPTPPQRVLVCVGVPARANPHFPKHYVGKLI